MPKAEMRAGQEIETLSQAELEKVLTKQTTTWFQEQARGFTTARFADTGTPDTGAIQIPATDDMVFGPDQGFAWAVQRITAAGLADDDVLLVYRNTVSDLNLVGFIEATRSFAPGSKGCILRGGEKLIIVGASLAAAADVSVNGEALQVAELDLYKVL